MSNNIATMFIATITTTMLTACGGGGGGSDPAPASSAPVTNAAVGGIWTGTSTSTDGTVYDTAGFITESGELRFITDDGEQTTGTITTTGNSFTASLTSYAPAGTVFVQNGETVITGSSSGDIQSRSTISGSVSVAGSVTSNFSFTYDSIYDRDSSLAAVSGIYSDSDGAGYTETYTVDSDGTITGSDTDGCIFGGAVSILNSNYNMYRVNLTVSSCGELDGSYTGLGALTDENGSLNDTFVISLTGPKYIITGFIPRT